MFHLVAPRPALSRSKGPALGPRASRPPVVCMAVGETAWASDPAGGTAPAVPTACFGAVGATMGNVNPAKKLRAVRIPAEVDALRIATACPRRPCIPGRARRPRSQGRARRHEVEHAWPRPPPQITNAPGNSFGNSCRLDGPAP